MREPWIGSNIDGPAALGIDIGGRRDAEAAGQRGGEIGQDVGVQVGGDDRVDAGRAAHHARGHRVDQLLVPAHVREVARHQGADLVPEHHAVALGVGFGDDCEVLARTGAGLLEGEAEDALDAAAGEDRGLGGDLLGQPAMRAPAIAGVLALASSRG